MDISIHALRKESDVAASCLRAEFAISIHALRKESDSTCAKATMPEHISIHALRKESDAIMTTPGFTDSIFQSTLSVRRATATPRSEVAGISISIHALRKESDCRKFHRQTSTINISIHALRKESDYDDTQYRRCCKFQSTLSVRRATLTLQITRWKNTFQSTLSVRRATLIHTIDQTHIIISIHALRKESDHCSSSSNR